MDAVPSDVREQRAILKRRGFEFCDSSDEELQAQHRCWQLQSTESEKLLNQQHAHEPLQYLNLVGYSATTTDHETQSIHCVTDGDDETFWSSSGSPSPNAVDDLVFWVGQGPCKLAAIRVACYRAVYQFGHPIYPPLTVSVHIGLSPWKQQCVLRDAPFLVTALPQTFLLPLDVPVGCYVKVSLNGRRQKQRQDDQFYTAIRAVEAMGICCAPQQVVHLQHHMTRPNNASLLGILPRSMLLSTPPPPCAVATPSSDQSEGGCAAASAPPSTSPASGGNMPAKESGIRCSSQVHPLGGEQQCAAVPSSGTATTGRAIRSRQGSASEVLLVRQGERYCDASLPDEQHAGHAQQPPSRSSDKQSWWQRCSLIR